MNETGEVGLQEYVKEQPEQHRIQQEYRDLVADRHALVRYVSYAVHDEACGMFDGPDIKDKDDIAREFCTCGYIEAYEALSQELRDAILEGE